MMIHAFPMLVLLTTLYPLRFSQEIGNKGKAWISMDHLGGSFWREREITSINTGSDRVRPGVGGVSHGRRHGSLRQVGSGLAEGGDGEGAAAGSGDEPCVVGSPGFVILPLRGGHGALVHGALNEVGAERHEAGDVFQVNRFAGCHEHVGASSISVAWREAEHVFEELVAQVSLDAHVGPGDEAVVCGELAGLVAQGDHLGDVA